MCLLKIGACLTLLHSERPKLCTILVFLSAVGLIQERFSVFCLFWEMNTCLLNTCSLKTDCLLKRGGHWDRFHCIFITVSGTARVAVIDNRPVCQIYIDSNVGKTEQPDPRQMLKTKANFPCLPRDLGKSMHENHV